MIFRRGVSKMKYRKKPIVVEAEQWFPGDEIDGVSRMTIEQANQLGIKEHWRYGWVETLKGEHIVSPGDYIITGIAGEKYPCKSKIFRETYEPVE
jgi:hypothetical protein